MVCDVCSAMTHAALIGRWQTGWCSRIKTELSVSIAQVTTKTQLFTWLRTPARLIAGTSSAFIPSVGTLPLTTIAECSIETSIKDAC